MPHSPVPQFSAGWERRIVASDGDQATLLVRIEAPDATSGSSHPPVDVAFALDRSGSMSGDPIDLVKQAVHVATGTLRPQDQVSLVVYDDKIDVLLPLQPASANARGQVRRLLDGIDARGSTNLGEGWLTACRQLAEAENRLTPTGSRLRRSLLLTDGLANVGIIDPGELVGHTHALRKRGISTSTLGVGEGFDESLLASMAEAGGGNFQFIPSPAELPAFFNRELGRLLATTVSSLRLFLTLPKGVRGTLISAFPIERNGKTFEITVGDLPAGDEVVLTFDITTPPARERETLSVGIQAEWLDPDTSMHRESSIEAGSLTVAAPEVARNATTDRAIAEQSALQHAAQEQREAMRLDREGRYNESRKLHKIAQSRLAAAPQSALISERLAEASVYAAYELNTPFPEDVRKQTVHNTMRRARGRADRS